MKTRFAKASLRARCARHRSETLPVGFPMVPWVTQLRNRRAAARSFLIHALVVKQLSVASHLQVIDCRLPTP